ncbi:hypothetical protein ACFFU2_12540 [Halomonas alkalicola]|uniref:hypothetical protein n=1 Tax=Halomonas alkalicola TaxID=1930622 RepID=UPI0035F05051
MPTSSARRGSDRVKTVPRSVSHERHLPNSLFSPSTLETRTFNGYAEEVAGLYAGMDLRKHF